MIAFQKSRSNAALLLVSLLASGCSDSVVFQSQDPRMIGDFEGTSLTASGWDSTDTTVVAETTINEVDCDTPGTDVLEFIELFDGGAGGTSLAGLVLVFFDGSTDTSYLTLDLGAETTDSNGYWVAGNSGVSPAPDLTFADGVLQNGADAVALYTATAASFPNGTAVTTTGLLDAVVYDTGAADDAGLLVLLNASEPQLDEAGNGSVETDSNHRYGDGSGGPRFSTGFRQGLATPGASNNPLRTAQVAAAGESPVGFGFFTSAPTSGTSAAVHGFDGVGAGRIGLFTDLILDNRVMLSFDYRLGWDYSLGATATLPRTLSVILESSGGSPSSPLKTVQVFEAPIATMTNLDSGALSAQVDLGEFEFASVRLIIAAEIPEGSSGPGFIQIDNVVLRP
jgi:hypothetical protein